MICVRPRKRLPRPHFQQEEGRHLGRALKSPEGPTLDSRRAHPETLSSSWSEAVRGVGISEAPQKHLKTTYQLFRPSKNLTRTCLEAKKRRAYEDKFFFLTEA